MHIFDKWGNLVFETLDIEQGWDGTFNGKPVNTGVYVYRMDATLKNGETLMESGNITLFR
jgi:gliding motility-associated-like protein